MSIYVKSQEKIYANQFFSKNFNSRPNETDISSIIIHYTHTDLVGALKTIKSKKTKVSYHYIIAENGDIFQFVKDHLRSWHAGQSAWGGKKHLNNSSIGIGLVYQGHDQFVKYGEWPNYEEKQIGATKKLIKQLKSKYNIELQNIVGHEHVSPKRKMDPGPAFPWAELYYYLLKK